MLDRDKTPWALLTMPLWVVLASIPIPWRNKLLFVKNCDMTDCEYKDFHTAHLTKLGSWWYIGRFKEGNRA